MGSPGSDLQGTRAGGQHGGGRGSRLPGGRVDRAGLEVEVRAGVGACPFGSNTDAGRVENIVATLPGRSSTGRVFLVAHYDTTFGSPGAADDQAAVAAIVESARALATSGPLRNELVFLLTDGEEPGLLGAVSFVDQHRYGASGGVVLNFEGAGKAGPTVLYQTSVGNAGLIEAYAAAAPHPDADYVPLGWVSPPHSVAELLDRFVPELRDEGTDEATINQLLVANPADLLTMREPSG